MLEASAVRVGIVLAAAGFVGAAGLQLTHAQVAGPSAAATTAATPQQPSAAPAPSAASPQRALLNQYCVTCHNDKRQTAGLMLDKMDVEHIGAGADVWEKVVRKLRARVMPPPGLPRPDEATRTGFVTWLETALDAAAAARPNPGRPAVHRLNRAEYTNAIRDLLALDIDARSLLPVDDSSYGFDNIADVLSVSPALLDRYVAAAEKISHLAIGDPGMSPVFERYGVSTFVWQDDRVSEELPFGTRGGMAVHHQFPVDGEYELEIGLERSEDQCCSPFLGLRHAHQLEVRLDGTRVALLTVGEERSGSRPPPGANSKANEDLVVRIPVKAGTRMVGVAFAKRSAAVPVGVGLSRLPMKSAAAHHSGGSAYLDEGDPKFAQVRIEGPYNVAGVGDTLSRQRIFVCRPKGSQDEEACAKTILSTLGRRAYRRSVTDDDLLPLLNFYQAGRKKGGFEAGIELALRTLLVDPDFLFRVEHNPPNATPGVGYRISDVELASRLSFFLWSSIPDDELLDVAGRGRLKDPAVLERQVRRMLGDARSAALVSNFAGQWLHLRNLRIVKPDAYLFPEFEDTLRESFQRETELFFEHQLREDRGVVELLTANYSFLNDRLARHYQVPNIYGAHYRKVTFAADGVRGGLLGQGSILTVTSYPDRTSPTQRGKWVLENILGTPPPPPPPDVPSLTERGKQDKPLSMRDRMEQHRTNPICAGCHRQMDPLGFGLENFDAIGRWRTRDGDTALDVTGALPDGMKFEGPAELRKLLVSRPEDFVATVTEKLLTYALGRGVESYDLPAVRQIMRDAAPGDYRWSSLILGIVKSVPFQMRMAQDAQPATSSPSAGARPQ